MTADDLPMAATIVGFCGALVLFIPGWRASRYLGQIERVRRIAEKNKDVADDPGPELMKVMQQQRTSWNAFDHWALLAGIGLLALSFVLDLAFQIR